MIVAGFDLATTSGVAVLDGSRVLYIDSFKATGETEAEIFRNFRRFFRGTIQRYGVQHVAIEQALVTDIKAPVIGGKPGETRNPVTMKTYLRLYGLRAMAVEAAGALGVPLIEIHQSTWRKSFTGNGRASKDDVLALAQRIVPGLKSKDSSDALGVAWHLNGVLREKKLLGTAA